MRWTGFMKVSWTWSAWILFGFFWTQVWHVLLLGHILPEPTPGGIIQVESVHLSYISAGLVIILFVCMQLRIWGLGGGGIIRPAILMICANFYSIKVSFPRWKIMAVSLWSSITWKLSLIALDCCNSPNSSSWQELSQTQILSSRALHLRPLKSSHD